MRAHQIFPTCRERHRKRDKDVRDENLSFVAESSHVHPNSSSVNEWHSVKRNGTFKSLKDGTFELTPGGAGMEVGRIRHGDAENGMICLHNHEAPSGEIYIRVVAEANRYGVFGSDIRVINICHSGEDDHLLDVSCETNKLSTGAHTTTYTASWTAADLSTVTIETSPLPWSFGGIGSPNYGAYDLKLFIPKEGRARLEATHMKSGKVFVTDAPSGHAEGINDKPGQKEIRIFHRKGERSTNHRLGIRRIGVGSKISGALP